MWAGFMTSISRASRSAQVSGSPTTMLAITSSTDGPPGMGGPLNTAPSDLKSGARNENETLDE